jgi:hypothetical protein
MDLLKGKSKGINKENITSTSGKSGFKMNPISTSKKWGGGDKKGTKDP